MRIFVIYFPINPFLETKPEKVLPPKKRFQEKTGPSEMKDEDAVEKSKNSLKKKIYFSVIRHTSCPGHYIPVYK